MTKKVQEAMRRMFAEYGRQGGKVGGKRRAERMTPEERSAAARKAARARWAKRKPAEPQETPPEAEEPIDWAAVRQGFKQP